MKVLHLISGGDIGGAKTHVLSLVKGLGAYMDVSMACFTEGPFVQEAREMGIRVRVYSGIRTIQTLHRLEKLIREEGYDLLHCHGSRGNLMGWLLKRRTGLPVVTTVHSDYRLDYLGRPLARMTYGTTNAVALRHMDYYIGVSGATADMLADRGFPPQKIFTIYNGLDFSPRVPALDRAAYLKSLGLSWPEDCIIAGITARLNPVKDIPTLLRGFALAQRRCPRLRLLIAGSGEELGRLKKLAAELGVEELVCFAGWITDTDSFYNALDINTLTSLSETFSYSLTEGARFRLATVASRVGGVTYLIDHGVHGLLFPARDVERLAEHLVTLAEHPELRRRLGDELYRRASADYSLQSTLNRQLEIYSVIMRRTARPRRRRDGVTICGAYGRGNAGDDAILEAILSELRQIDPDLPLRVLSKDPRSTRRVYKVEAIHIFNMPGFFRRLLHSELYINGGGSLMQDATSRRSLWYYLFTISTAKRLGCKVMMYGCGIGPIRHPDNIRKAARILNNAVDVITLRDSNSRDELRAMAVTQPEIVLSGDPTVILPTAPEAVANGILEAAGLDPAARFIAFSLRPWWGYREKAPVFGAAADYAYEKYGLIPVFVPIEAHDDTIAARQAAEYIRHAPYRIMSECANSAQTISLFARMDIVVSIRLHALVFAAGHGVPLVGVVYDQKVSSFLDAVGQDLYTGLSTLTEERLFALIDAAAAHRGDRALRTAGVERLRQTERLNSEYAERLIRESREDAQNRRTSH